MLLSYSLNINNRVSKLFITAGSENIPHPPAPSPEREGERS
jgi:hypothetical protein